MLSEHVAEGIHMIDDAYVNWLLVEEGQKLTVVDTGHPSSWKSLQQALSSLGRSTGDIEAVVLTHGHFDHMGFARRAHEELGVPVWAPELETPVVPHPWRYDHERSRMPYFVRHPAFVRIFTAMGASVSRRDCRRQRQSPWATRCVSRRRRVPAGPYRLARQQQGLGKIPNYVGGALVLSRDSVA